MSYGANNPCLEFVSAKIAILKDRPGKTNPLKDVHAAPNRDHEPRLDQQTTHERIHITGSDYDSVVAEHAGLVFLETWGVLPDIRTDSLRGATKSVIVLATLPTKF